MNTNTGKAFVWMLLAHTLTATAAELVRDESVRLEALSAIFPGMTIAKTPHKKDPAFLGEPVYFVDGDAATANERCAADDLLSRKQSTRRELQFRLYSLSGNRFINIAQYKFENANPAAACWSIARMSLLEKTQRRVMILSEFEPNTQHHSAITSVRFHGPQLFLKSDDGGAGIARNCLYVVEIHGTKLSPIVVVATQVDGESMWKQTLDWGPTSVQKYRYCFNMVERAEDGVMFPKPKISHPCYSRGDGLDEFTGTLR